MKLRLRSTFGIVVFFCTVLISAQTAHHYDFEGDSANWTTTDSALWAHTAMKAASGSYSLAYSVGTDAALPQTTIMSIDTEHHTIMKVRTAQKGEDQIIIGSDYEGMVLAVDYGGAILWKAKTGGGTMNHDLWSEDITGDGNDEILVANANGHTYCFTINGKLLWDFQPFDGPHLTPMYAVTVVKDASLTPYVVCGDFTCNMYYLNTDGTLEKKIHSTKYSLIKAWGDYATRPPDYYSYPNFLRPIPLPDGSDLLLINANNNHMQSNGDFYLMKPLSETRYLTISDLKIGSEIGDLRVVDPDGDGLYEVLYGNNSLSNISYNKLTFTDKTYKSYSISSNYLNYKFMGVNSYRVNQFVPLYNADADYDYALLTSKNLYTIDKSKAGTSDSNYVAGTLEGTYTYNDICTDKSGKLILASSQDGGSCIHIINTKKPDWGDAFENLEPIGNIAKMKAGAKQIRENLEGFEKPEWQGDPRLVTGFEGSDLPIASKIEGSKSLELFKGTWNHGKCQEPSWRSPLYDGNRFKDTRDKRNKYEYSAQQIFDLFAPEYNSAPGIQHWGGHGNDPLYYDLKVLTDLADYGWAKGKRTIYVYPEMNHHDTDFGFLMDHQIYPLADHLSTMEGRVAFRAKDAFWQGHVYTPTWKHVVSGKYAETAIPMLEETTDKTQDLSIEGRMGLWLAGSVDGWGVRCSRDDPSFDRSRQFSSQKLSNHFLRKTIYSVACGATYLHNAYPDTENSKLEYHTSLALELIAAEALYVPKRNEILSINPVHLSIYNPQDRYMNEASNNKWNTYYDKADEENNPMVFSHMNGSWLGGTLTPWDFSSYANSKVDRRQNAVPYYPNGQVLITPVQNGALADTLAPRGKLVDHLHPIYKDIMKEYITDGVDYISADGTQRFKANEYYTQIKKDIEEGAKKLPISVSGDQVAWVVAQVSPTHLRLTLVDAPWLSPDDRKVTVSFNTVTPVKVQDMLDKEVFGVSNAATEIEVPCGMFRFIDIEIANPL